MKYVYILAKFDPLTGEEVLVGLYDNEEAIQNTLKKAAVFNLHGGEVRLNRDFSYRVYKFKTNVAIEAGAPLAEDHGDIVLYKTIQGNAGLYGLAIDSQGKAQGCTCQAYEFGRGEPCKHMREQNRKR